jgi:hypothetical protein
MMGKCLKTTALLALLAALCAVFVSCSKQPAQDGREMVPGGEALSGFSDTEWAVPAGAAKGVVLYQAGVFEIESGNQLKWVKSASAGDIVEWKDESQKLVYRNDENDYSRVYAGGDYWIYAGYVKGPAEPGVIIGSETMLYSRPEPTGVITSGNNMIHENTVVAVHPDQSSDFVKISAYYVNAGKYYRVTERYVKVENVSMDINDVKGIALYQLAMVTADARSKREFLNNALEFSDRYYDLVQRALVEIEYADKIETIPARDFTVAEDELSVYDRPDGSGEWVDTVKYGAAVTALSRTKERSSLYGASGYWYKIAEPEGWVFGAYLESPASDSPEETE